MAFNEICYSVLVVSSSEKFNRSMSAWLPPARYDPTAIAESADQARRMLLERKFDLAVINTPLTDDFGVRLAADLSANSAIGILIFVKNELFDEVSAKLFGTGVLILPKPTSVILISQSLRLLCASREKLRRLERQNETLEEKMEEIRLVNRAKWILISELKMTETEAHRYIEKSAMDLCVPKRDIAGRIIKTYQT